MHQQLWGMCWFVTAELTAGEGKPNWNKYMKYWAKSSLSLILFLHGEGPRSRCYRRTTALRLFVQPYDEDEQFFLPSFTITGASVE
jgi:hypothetical protein